MVADVDEVYKVRERLHLISNEVQKLMAWRDEHTNLPEEVTRLRIKVQGLEIKLLMAGVVGALLGQILRDIVGKLLTGGAA